MNTIYKTKTEQLTAFTAIFDPKSVKWRSNGSMELCYYPVEVIRERLNAVFPGFYDLRTGEVVPSEHSVDMSVVLTLRWVDGTISIIEEWGSSDVLMSKSGSSRTSESYKTAFSDALKRCCAAVGCGSELWNEEYRKKLEADRNKLPEKKQRDFSKPVEGSRFKSPLPPPPAMTKSDTPNTGSEDLDY